MTLQDEVLAVFRARPRQTLSSYHVSCVIYRDRVIAAGTYRGISFPSVKQVRSCIHALQKTHPHLRRRRRPQLTLVHSVAN